MRLHKHDELVEAMREAIVKPRYSHAATYEIAAAARVHAETGD